MKRSVSVDPPRRRIIEQLARHTEDELLVDLREVQQALDVARSEQDDLDRKIQILEAEHQVIAQMLRIMRWERDGVPGMDGAVEALRHAEPVARERTISDNVLSVVKQAGKPLTPAEVQERMAHAGVDADPSSIRGALRRWVGRGMLERVGSSYQRGPQLTS